MKCGSHTSNMYIESSDRPNERLGQNENKIEREKHSVNVFGIKNSNQL